MSNFLPNISGLSALTGLSGVVSSGGGGGGEPVTGNTVFNVQTDRTGTSNDDQFTLPLIATGTYDFYIDWGDGGGLDHITAHDDACTTHTFAGGANTYTVTVYGNGTLRGWRFGNAGDSQKMVKLSAWGILEFGANAQGAFYGCQFMQINATDYPDLSNTTSMRDFMRGCLALDVGGLNVSQWNTASVTTTQAAFRQSDLTNSVGWENLNLDHVQTASFMFYSSINANAVNCSSWKLNSATTLQAMFYSTNINRDLNWQLGQASNMQEMLFGCASFNGAVNAWEMSTVSSLRSTFRNCTNFNRPVNWTNTVGLTTIQEVFYNADSFDQSLETWNISNITNMFSVLAFAPGISTANYDATLLAWQPQSKNSGLTINMGGSKYTPNSAASIARNTMENTDGWTINDGGPAV
jgi:hypothetical protein